MSSDNCHYEAMENVANQWSIQDLPQRKGVDLSQRSRYLRFSRWESTIPSYQAMIATINSFKTSLKVPAKAKRLFSLRVVAVLQPSCCLIVCCAHTKKNHLPDDDEQRQWLCNDAVIIAVIKILSAAVQLEHHPLAVDAIIAVVSIFI